MSSVLNVYTLLLKGIVHPKIKILSLITSTILESFKYLNHVCTWIRCLHSDQTINNVNSVSAYGTADTEQHTLFMYVILSKMALYRVTR